jgi:hypothetical protein
MAANGVQKVRRDHTGQFTKPVLGVEAGRRSRQMRGLLGQERCGHVVSTTLASDLDRGGGVARRNQADYDGVARRWWVGGVTLGLERRGGGCERMLFNFAVHGMQAS